MKKFRLLSGILAFLMIFSTFMILPVTAAEATEEVEDAVEEVVDEIEEVVEEEISEEDTYDEEDALADLKKTIDVLDAAPLESLLDDRVSGLHRLSAVTYKFKSRMDFGVFNAKKSPWSFHDIMGTIVNQGLCDANMLHNAINDIPPTSVSVTELLDDDEMRRVY
mgnify:CR=1 FL=1